LRRNMFPLPMSAKTSCTNCQETLGNPAHAEERSRQMEGSILALLEQHGSLGYEQVAAHLGERPMLCATCLRVSATAASSIFSVWAS
jgi:hypothetical protein